MAVGWVLEKDKLFFECDECKTVFSNLNDFIYGHDCEVE